MGLYTRVSEVDESGTRTPVSVHWSWGTLTSFLNIAEEQGIIDDLRSLGEATLKEDAVLQEVIFGEEVKEKTGNGFSIVYPMTKSERHLKAGTVLEMWRIG